MTKTIKPTNGTLWTLLPLFLAACGASRAEMHQHAATGTVQADAPLHALHKVEIRAPRERVWALLIDVARWPKWHPIVRTAAAPDGMADSRWFTWNNDGTEIKSQVARASAPTLLSWTGTVATASAAHIWRLRALPNGHTEVEVEETMDGFLLTLFYSQAKLDKAVTDWLADLRRAAEAPAHSS